MNDSQRLLLQQMKEIETMIQKAQKNLAAAPDGILRVITNHNSPQYYKRNDRRDKCGKYIKKAEIQIAKELAQKDYAEKILKVARKKQKLLKQCVEALDIEDIEMVYHELSLERQNLVVPYLLDDQSYVEKWMQSMNLVKVKHGRDDFAGCDSDSLIYTEQGEIVRSKSEKILADKLYLMGIPYVYEVPLCIDGFGYIKPDFTTLNVRTRSVFYWEHLGIMDDPVYCEKAVRKIDGYIRNGIFPGKKLLLTYETKKYPINMNTVEKLIIEYLE